MYKDLINDDWGRDGMELYSLNSFKRELESDKQRIFRSQRMKEYYNDYIKYGMEFCDVCEKLNENLANLRGLHNKPKSIEPIHTDYETIDIERIKDPAIKKAYMNMLEAKELHRENINIRNNIVDKFHDIGIRVLNELELTIESIINSVIKEDYKDYSAIIDMINIILNNIPFIPNIVNVLSNVSDIAEVVNKLDNQKQKEKTLSELDLEMQSIEQKVEIFKIMIQFFESLSMQIETA